MAQVRLQRFLAQAGVASRRKAERLILDGVVTVNGKVVTKLGTKVDPDKDAVAVSGQGVRPNDHFYCVLNKPKGCVTSVGDPHGRRTVMEYIMRVPVPVVPVGRLDFYSEGVLLLTNDGELAAALLAPETHVEKTYHVKLRGKIGEAAIRKLRKGVRLPGGGSSRPAQIDRLRHKSKHDWLIITLTEGKSRQIHRMAEAVGLEVSKIQRVAFAGIGFHGLRVGDARELTQAEVNQLHQSVGLKRSSRSVARGKWSARREDSELARRARDRDRPVLGDAPQKPARAAPTSRRSKRPAQSARSRGGRRRR